MNIFLQKIADLKSNFGAEDKQDNSDWEILSIASVVVFWLFSQISHASDANMGAVKNDINPHQITISQSLINPVKTHQGIRGLNQIYKF